VGSVYSTYLSYWSLQDMSTLCSFCTSAYTLSFSFLLLFHYFHIIYLLELQEQKEQSFEEEEVQPYFFVCPASPLDDTLLLAAAAAANPLSLKSSSEFVLVFVPTHRCFFKASFLLTCMPCFSARPSSKAKRNWTLVLSLIDTHI
jgi:hypothetical protein